MMDEDNDEDNDDDNDDDDDDDDDTLRIVFLVISPYRILWFSKCSS